MKFVVFLSLAIFIVELVPGNLKLRKVETVLRKVEGAEHLYKLHLWSISSKDLALFRQIIIKNLSTRFARNMIHQIQPGFKEGFNVEDPTQNLVWGLCQTMR